MRPLSRLQFALSCAGLGLVVACSPLAVRSPEPTSLQEARQRFASVSPAAKWPRDPSFSAPVPLQRSLFALPVSASRHAVQLAESLAPLALSPTRLLEELAKQAPRAVPRPRGAQDRSAPDWLPKDERLADLPATLRAPIREALLAIATADADRRAFLSSVSPGLTPARLMAQLKSGPGAPDDYREVIGRVDVSGLARSAAGLLHSIERLRQALNTTSPLLPVEWRLETPLGLVLVDTTGRNNTHNLRDPLLIVDVGGDDVYRFDSRSAANRIAIVLDHGGNDTYESLEEGADPSAGILGFGILWDTAGNDTYRGSAFSQASAAFGVAVLIDEGGDNRFEAQAYSQAHALSGVAIVVSGIGFDQYFSLTASQASGGPAGVALLLDRGGDDQYRLGNSPLVRPSAQLAERNASMGQGAGYGIRAGYGDEGSGAGGLGLLVDLAGNDRYEAQVFGQGVGYQGGVGILIDSGGDDRFDATWYALGAAAHGAAGVFVKRGKGDDRYRVSHVMGLGAAHDLSVASFEDEGGDDAYVVDDLGFGAAHDSAVAQFIDASGVNRYEITGQRCRGFGVADRSQPGGSRERLPQAALFAGEGAKGRATGPCARAWPETGWRLAR